MYVFDLKKKGCFFHSENFNMPRNKIWQKCSGVPNNPEAFLVFGVGVSVQNVAMEIFYLQFLFFHRSA